MKTACLLSGAEEPREERLSFVVVVELDLDLESERFFLRSSWQESRRL